MVRQKGSHLVLRRDEPFCQVVLPRHDAIHTGTLRNILADAEISVAEFLASL